jgi:hypothetical protein
MAFDDKGKWQMATGMATGNPAIVHSHGEMFLK